MNAAKDVIVSRARQRWLDTMRDPANKKARERLARSANSNQRCCLGHACAAMGVSLDDIYHEEYLPREVAATLNISMRGALREPVYINGIKIADLTQINDDLPKTMRQIADFIEQQFTEDNIVEYRPDEN